MLHAYYLFHLALQEYLLLSNVFSCKSALRSHVKEDTCDLITIAGTPQDTVALHERSSKLFRQLNDPGGPAHALVQIAKPLEVKGRYADAE